MMGQSHRVNAIALRSSVWVGFLLLLVGLVAWKISWQAACWIALAFGSATVLWHVTHVHWLLDTMQNVVNDDEQASLGSQGGQSKHRVESALGVWGEVFYVWHRAKRQHGLDLAELINQQARFTQAIQASPNAFVMLDDAGRVAWLNVAAQALLGLDTARDTGQNLAYLLRTPAVAALLDSTRQSAPIKVLTNGKTVSVQALPFGDSQTLLLGQDLSEIERTDRVRRDFVANVSHELRTPLTVLTGYTELLHDHANELPAALQDAVKHMRHHTLRMSLLTQDLLQLAALDAGEAISDQQELEPVIVAHWLNSVQQASITLIADQAASASLAFNTIDSAWQVQGQPSQLHSALSNLVTNALRYTPAGGKVIVSCAVENNQCCISVTDTGCGIAAEHLPRLTERFYRVSASRQRTDLADNDYSGTGLGLAIVKHIMQRHGGELRIASELGRGSCFTLVLPLIAPTI